MEILKGIEILSSCLLIKRKSLVISDLHMGYEEALNKHGVLIPRSQFKETEAKLNEIFKQTGKIETIIINGDLKHEFSAISEQEWSETLKVFDILQKHCKKIILVKGNHDTFLGPIAKKRGLEIKDYYCLEDICILHGEKIIQNLDVSKAKILIIGHEHPAISLREGMKQETYKCFLFGTWKKQKLIVMPSFLPIIEGSDIKGGEILSPYLIQNLDNFEVFILGDKVYKFGKLKNIQ